MSEDPRAFGPITVDQFRPKSQARLATTEVSQARFRAIDAHNHFRENMDPAAAVAHMDACNVQTFVDLSGGHGDQLLRRLLMLKGGPYADRFAVFFVPDLRDIHQSDFGEVVARELEKAKQAGVQGVKINKELGLHLRDNHGRLVTVDDQRLSPMWDAAGELDLPVMMHTADPWAYFEPLTPTNERYVQLFRDPSRHFYGGDCPTVNELLEQRDRVLARHPRTRFIGAHIGSMGEDLQLAATVLDAYPNFYVDISARVAELGRKPRQTREFFLRYQDRILFGTDGLDAPSMYWNHFRFLETTDECFEDWMYPHHGLFYISGLYLPDDVLRKVYATNALRIIPGLHIEESPQRSESP